MISAPRFRLLYTYTFLPRTVHVAVPTTRSVACSRLHWSTRLLFPAYAAGDLGCPPSAHFANAPRPRRERDPGAAGSGDGDDCSTVRFSAGATSATSAVAPTTGAPGVGTSAVADVPVASGSPDATTAAPDSSEATTATSAGDTADVTAASEVPDAAGASVVVVVVSAGDPLFGSAVPDASDAAEHA